jgi:hypothetical protein
MEYGRFDPHAGSWRNGKDCPENKDVSIDTVVSKGMLDHLFSNALKQLEVGRWYTGERVQQLTAGCITKFSAISDTPFSFRSGLDTSHPKVLERAPHFFSVRVVDTPSRKFRYFRVDPMYWRDKDDPMPSDKEELADFIDESYPQSFLLQDLYVYHEAKDHVAELVQEGRILEWKVGATRKISRYRSFGKRGIYEIEPFVFSQRAQLILDGKIGQFTKKALSHEKQEKLSGLELERALEEEMNGRVTGLCIKRDEVEPPRKRVKRTPRKKRKAVAPRPFDVHTRVEPRRARHLAMAAAQ